MVPPLLLLAAAAAGAGPGPGECLVSTPPSPNTDEYYVAAFASRADAAPADGAAQRVLTLTRTGGHASATIGGLVPGRAYWFRWRSHNASNPTLARGWRDYGAPFACTAGPPLQGPAPQRAASANSSSRFMYLYRVSEYTDEVDFLANHNSASEGAQAGFLTNTDSSLFFNFNTTAVSRYCVEYVPSNLADPGKDPDDQ